MSCNGWSQHLWGVSDCKYVMHIWMHEGICNYLRATTSTAGVGTGTGAGCLALSHAIVHSHYVVQSS
jgi:hypothetical protein